MDAVELVERIRSDGPKELELKQLVRFRRRTRSNPCGFDEFLEALRKNGTIESVFCTPIPGFQV